jgi:putative pyruvate formate lyase activating enzyme
VDRFSGKTGFCRETSALRLAVATRHFGEEPPLTCRGGSGTIFVTGCNLRCAFCQNYQISQHGYGETVSVEKGAELCLKLEAEGAENINIVTGSHAIPAIAAVLEEARRQGLAIPVCWNTSSYETTEALEMLDGLVDIWLPDLKTLNPMMSEAVFKAADYPKVAKKAIRWMIEHSQKKFLKLDKPYKIPGSGDAPPVTEKMLSGVIVRHLILPGRISDTKLVLDWLKQHADNITAPDGTDKSACISLMCQYTPVKVQGDNADEKTFRQSALTSFQNRLLTEQDFEEIRTLIETYDFTHLFYQELDEDTGWLPDFTKEMPFSAALAVPVWHCRV